MHFPIYPTCEGKDWVISMMVWQYICHSIENKGSMTRLDTQ